MKAQTVGDVTIVEMISKLDAHTAEEAEASIMKLIDKGATKILCDFSGTEYISSAGLSVLLSVAKKLKKLGGEAVICSLRPFVRQVIEMTGFTRLFKIYQSSDEALKNFS